MGAPPEFGGPLAAEPVGGKFGGLLAADTGSPRTRGGPLAAVGTTLINHKLTKILPHSWAENKPAKVSRQKMPFRP